MLFSTLRIKTWEGPYSVIQVSEYSVVPGQMVTAQVLDPATGQMRKTGWRLSGEAGEMTCAEIEALNPAGALIERFVGQPPKPGKAEPAPTKGRARKAG